MNITKLAWGLSLAGAVAASTPFAEQGFRQPAHRTSFEFDYYEAPPAPPAPTPKGGAKSVEKSPSDKAAPMPSAVVPMAPMAPAPMPVADVGCESCAASNCGTSCNSGSSCGNSCGCHSGCDHSLCCPDAPPVCRLFDDCCWLKEHCMTLTGYADLGGTVNGENPSDRWNGTLGANDRNEFQLNQLYFALEKATKAGDCDWDLGGRLDLMYGTDARWYESAGLERTSGGKEKWVTNERFYHLALIQAYGEIAFDDWKAKFGKWNTPMGYEVVDSTANFFYSHSYMCLYGMPFTQTGLLATKTVDEQLSYSLGFSTGWDNFFDNQQRVDFVGSINLTSCDKRSNLVFTIITGDERTTDPDALPIESNRTAYDIVFTRKLTDRLAWTIEHNFGIQQKGAYDPNWETVATRAGQWYGITNYLTYQLSCDWWLGGRFEWFRDPDGTRVLPVGDTLTGGTSNSASNVGYEGNFYEYTIGLNYKPVCNPNLVVRPEVRWDHFDGQTNNAPFKDGNKNDQFTFAIDATIKF